MKGALANALKSELTFADRERLYAFIDSLPAENTKSEPEEDIPPDDSSKEAHHMEVGDVA